MNIREIIKLAEEQMVRDPGLAAFILRDTPEVEAAGLKDLCWCLASGQWGAHKNDVIGVIELLEKFLDNANQNTPNQSGQN